MNLGGFFQASAKCRVPAPKIVPPNLHKCLGDNPKTAKRKTNAGLSVSQLVRIRYLEFVDRSRALILLGTVSHPRLPSIRPNSG